MGRTVAFPEQPDRLRASQETVIRAFSGAQVGFPALRLNCSFLFLNDKDAHDAETSPIVSIDSGTTPGSVRRASGGTAEIDDTEVRG